MRGCMQSYAYRRNPSGSEQATIQTMSSTTLADLARACKPGFIPSRRARALDQNVRCHKQPTGTTVTIPSSHSSWPSRFRLVAAVTSASPDRCDMQGQDVNLHCLPDRDPSTRALTPLDHLPSFPPTQRVPLFFHLVPTRCQNYIHYCQERLHGPRSRWSRDDDLQRRFAAHATTFGFGCHIRMACGSSLLRSGIGGEPGVPGYTTS